MMMLLHHIPQCASIERGYLLRCLVVAAISAPVTTARAQTTSHTYYVAPLGNDAASGTSPDTPLQTIQRAVDLAQPGDTIRLAPGRYFQDVVSRRDGALNAPITVTGPTTAVVQGASSAHIIDIHLDHITLNGFTIDGLSGDPR
jgi:hypothetical protein